MKCDLQVVECGSAELDEIMSIMTLAFDPSFGEAWSRAQTSGMLGLPGVLLLLARHDDHPAGFALCRTTLDEAELLLLGVMPHFRRTGIATALLAEVTARVREAGARRLHLEMRQGNPAEMLYRAHDFNVVGRRANYYRGNDGMVHDAISLSRNINSQDQSHN